MLFMIDQPLQAAIHPQNEAAIVTLAIGESFLNNWHKSARESWEYYGQKHQLDIIVITQPIDVSESAMARSPAWQKCLILSQPWSSLYQRIIWLDTDILINPNALDVREGVADPKMGAVVTGDHLSPAQKQMMLERRYHNVIVRFPKMSTPQEIEACWEDFVLYLYREQEGIDTQQRQMINTGVLVLTPSAHRGLLEEAYRYPQRTRTYEQRALSHLALTAGVVHPLNPRFNWTLVDIWNIHFPRLIAHVPAELFSDLIVNELLNAYFLHFACLEAPLKQIAGIQIVPYKTPSPAS